MTSWKIDDLEHALKDNGLFVESTREIQHGNQIILKKGTKVSCYKTGKTIVQGGDKEERELAEKIINSYSSPNKSKNDIMPPQDMKVFVVYGHDSQARKDLELLLLRMNIKPVILANMTPSGQTIIEALIENTNVPYAIILLTPDDEGYKKGCSDQKRYRARQNVVLEMGMFLSKLGREKIAILHKGDLELPSDISGLIYIPFNNSIDEVKNKLAANLQKAGFYIDIESLQAD